MTLKFGDLVKLDTKRDIIFNRIVWKRDQLGIVIDLDFKKYIAKILLPTGTVDVFITYLELM